MPRNDEPSPSADQAPTNWEWRTDEFTTCGVSLSDDRIVYWEQGPRDQGGASEQSVLDFLAFGPRDALPEGVQAELLAAVRRQAGRAWPALERAAVVHRRQIERERAAAARAEEAKQTERIASYAAAKKLKDPWRSYAGAGAERRRATPGATQAGMAPRRGAAATRWRAIVGWSLAIQAGLVAAAIALAYWSPYVAGFFVLFTGVILMILAPVWFDAWSLSLAAILAAIGAIGAALSLDRARELGAGEIVRDISVAAAPRHPGATGFVFRDARILADRSGSYRRVIYRTHGSGPNVQVTYYVVAPLVPRDWQPGAPVPAWAACDATYESDCNRTLARSRPVAAVIVRRYDRDTYYAPAVAAALRQHGLAAAPGAPVLALTDDPAGVGAIYRRAVWWAQPAAFALWLAAFAGWGLWRRFRRRSAGA